MGETPYIVAECGINAGGDSGHAVDMIHAAEECGADAVKFQKYNMDCAMPWIPDKQLLIDCQLTESGWRAIAETASKLEIDWFASAFCEHALKELEKYGPCRWKSAAPDLTKASEWAKITPLDWWASYDPRFARHDDVYSAEIAGEAEVIFRCVSDYPAELSQYHTDDLFNYNAISDHTAGLEFADYAGDCFTYWEKHFKIDDDCVDADVSLNASDMKRYVEMIHAKHEDYTMEDERLKRMMGRFE